MGPLSLASRWRPRIDCRAEAARTLPAVYSTRDYPENLASAPGAPRLQLMLGEGLERVRDSQKREAGTTGSYAIRVGPAPENAVGLA